MGVQKGDIPSLQWNDKDTHEEGLNGKAMDKETTDKDKGQEPSDDKVSDETGPDKKTTVKKVLHEESIEW